jgi:hypothetical protein
VGPAQWGGVPAGLKNRKVGGGMLQLKCGGFEWDADEGGKRGSFCLGFQFEVIARVRDLNKDGPNYQGWAKCLGREISAIKRNSIGTRTRAEGADKNERGGCRR